MGHPMPYKNTHHRVRLNKTEAITLLEATHHALQCRKKKCDECAEIEAYLRRLERLIDERSR